MRPLGLALSTLLLAACDATSGGHVAFPVSVAGIGGPVVTDSGWSVQLTRASLELVAGRFEGELVAVAAPPWRRAVDLAWGSAWAHPGHGVQGVTLAEVLTPVSVDLLEPGARPWGEARGVSGPARTLSLTCGEAGLALEGRGSRGGVEVTWSATWQPTLVLAGIAAGHPLTDATGGAVLELNLPVLLSRVDFSKVGAGAAPLDPASEAFNGLVRGASDLAAWSVRWEEAP